MFNVLSLNIHKKTSDISLYFLYFTEFMLVIVLYYFRQTVNVKQRRFSPQSLVITKTQFCGRLCTALSAFKRFPVRYSITRKIPW